MKKLAEVLVRSRAVEAPPAVATPEPDDVRAQLDSWDQKHLKNDVSNPPPKDPETGKRVRTTGRPRRRRGLRRTDNMTVTLSTQERDLIESYCDVHDFKSVSEFIREAAFAYMKSKRFPRKRRYE